MTYYGSHINKLIEEFSRLPGIGYKTARRLAFYVLNMPKDQAEGFANSIIAARNNTRYCSKCYTVTDNELCDICRSSKRDKTTIMVVEETNDLVAYEKTGQYTGLYHVLQGVISPMQGIGPEDLRIKPLLERVVADQAREVILATNSTIEGETTSIYIGKLLKTLNVKTTRIAKGVPVGGNLEYVDEVTLLRALEGRTDFLV